MRVLTVSCAGKQCSKNGREGRKMGGRKKNGGKEEKRGEGGGGGGGGHLNKLLCFSFVLA